MRFPAAHTSTGHTHILRMDGKVFGRGRPIITVVQPTQSIMGKHATRGYAASSVLCLSKTSKYLSGRGLNFFHNSLLRCSFISRHCASRKPRNVLSEAKYTSLIVLSSDAHFCCGIPSHCVLDLPFTRCP